MASQPVERSGTLDGRGGTSLLERFAGSPGVPVIAVGMVLLCILSAPVAAQGTADRSQLTIEEAVAMARANHPQVVQAQAATAAARARSGRALSSLLPQMGFHLGWDMSVGGASASTSGLESFDGTEDGVQISNSFSAGVSVSQLVYDFGQTIHRRQATQAQERAQELDEESTSLSVALNVRLAYFSVLAMQSMVAVTEEALANQQRHLEQIEAFVQVGTRPEIDLAQARSDLAQARLDFIEAESGLQLARVQLGLAMGIDGEMDFELVSGTYAAIDGEEGGVVELLDEAVETRPDLAAMDEQMRAQELSIEAAHDAFWPTLNASTGFSGSSRSLDELSWNWYLGLSLNGSFYQGGSRRAAVREADANLLGLDAQLRLARQQLRAEIDQVLLDIRAAIASGEACREAVNNARRQLELAEGRYENGMGSVLELSDAQLGLTRTLAQEVQANYDLASARAQLLAALGRD